MIASSVACIMALIVSILGLVRALFDLTWPLSESGADQICLQFGPAQSDVPYSISNRTAPGVTSRSPRPVVGLAPTSTPMPLTPTPVPSVALSSTVQITSEVVYSATAAHTFNAPTLLSPEPDAKLHSEVQFQWQWDGQPLPEGLAFDLLIWSEAEHEEHQGAEAYGVIETDLALERDVDLDYVETIIDHGGGNYYWTVIVVQEDPYRRVGAWGEKRPFTYKVPEPPEESSTQSP